MNSKSKIKTLFVMMLVICMIIGTLSTAYAAPVVPSADDTANIRIYGIEAGSTVNAYQVAQATYNTYGLVSYETVPNVTIANLSAPTEAEITALAQAIYAETLTLTSIPLTYNTESGAYESALAKAGSYLCLVTNTTGEYVYNPIYVSNAYTDANVASSLGGQAGNGTVNVTENTGNNSLSTTGTVYAKKSHTTLDKDIVSASTENTETEDVAVGDTVDFLVSTIIPDYSDGFEALDFTIADTQDAGLLVPNDFVVSTGTNAEALTPLTESEATYTLTVTGNDWTIDFADAWIKNHPLEIVHITYRSVVGEDATLGLIANKNEATLTFTTVPDATYTYSDTVSVFSFEISAEKVDANDTETKLAGAEFSLVGDSTYTATSNEDGVITFTGLDAGSYTLTETKAPDGYALSTKVYTIVITPTYDADLEGVTPNGTVETMISYTVTTTDNDTGFEVASATFNAESTGTDINLDVLNTNLSTLPSTGGIGTKAFTVFGIGLVILGCVCLGFKRKSEDK